MYFCAHPEEKSFLEEISDDVLEIVDCTVYYDDESNKDYDSYELEFLLSQKNRQKKK